MHLLALIYYELILRKETKKKHIDIKDFSYFQFGFVIRPLINVLMLRVIVHTVAMKKAVSIFAFTHYLIIISLIIYQLRVMNVI